MKPYLKIIFDGSNLTRQQAFDAMNLMMSGTPSVEEMAAFLGAMRGKGETVDELVGFAQSLRRHVKSVSGINKALIDTCGTGGDGFQTFNISTTCAFVIAAAGLGVVKHGNRAQSSKCGSADVLEALDLQIDCTAEEVKSNVESFGFAFLFAPKFHPAMKYVAPVRRKLGLRTVFNLLGPMVNPANTARQFMGVYDVNLLEKIATALKELGSEHVIVVSGLDGMDEISLCAPSRVLQLKSGSITEMTIKPEDFGFVRCQPGDLIGSSASENADILVSILSGKEKGPKRDIVLLNAAAALVVGDKAEHLADGIQLARSLLDSRKPFHIMQSLRIMP